MSTKKYFLVVKFLEKYVKKYLKKYPKKRKEILSISRIAAYL